MTSNSNLDCYTSIILAIVVEDLLRGIYMRHIIRCCLMFGFVLSFSPSFSVEADEIDDMVYSLNSKLIKSDVEGFSGLVTEFTSREKRFEDANYSKVGKTAASILTSMAI